MPSGKLTRRHFTDAARAAALAAKLRKQEVRAAMGNNCPEVFVVRHLGGTLEFQWEIRRFGGVVVDRSTSVFLRTSDARSAGNHALSSHLEQVG
jgi:hypothetical protein